jgi:amino acid transporter
MVDTAQPAVPQQLDRTTRPDDPGLQRSISWTGAFWIASGVPALVLTSIGTIAATVGTPSVLVWTVSVAFGLIQSAVFAEIAGMYPHKSGGASVYGAMAWAPYSKFIAPISVWCNWLAWSPVLAIGAGLGAGYLITALFPPDSLINTWSLSLVDLGALKEGLELRINAQFVIAAALLLLVFVLQHHGVLRTARVQTIMGVAVLVPLLVIGVVPLLTGDVASANFVPFEPLDVGWGMEGWTLIAGGLFLAAWSAYAFETSVCYTREFKDPSRDTPRAIFSSGLVCLVIYVLVPLTFLGVLGLDRLVEDDIVAGSGVAAAMVEMIGGGAVIGNLLTVMLILALLLSVMTTMAGSSRTLYQGSLDGWLPRYLGKANQHGAPARAMWTDLGFNLVLLLMSDYVFVLAASTVCYMIFNFLNLNAGWLHRRDNPDVPRPWRAPTVLIGAGAVLAFVNALLLGWGANVWGQGALATGLVFAALVIPVFAYRHYIQDKGKFPESMYDSTTTGVAVDPTTDGAAEASAVGSAEATAGDASADDASADEAGADEAGADEAGADEASADEASADEASAPEASDASAPDAKAPDASAPEAGADEASSDEASADEASAAEASAAGTSAAETSAAGTSAAGTVNASVDAPDVSADGAAETGVDGAPDTTAEASADSADTVADGAADSTAESAVTSRGRQAELLPYLVLAGGAVMVVIGQLLAY